MVERSGFSHCSDLPFERKVMQYHGCFNHSISALKIFPIPVKLAYGNYEKGNFYEQFCMAEQGMIQIIITFECSSYFNFLCI